MLRPIGGGATSVALNREAKAFPPHPYSRLMEPLQEQNPSRKSTGSLEKKALYILSILGGVWMVGVRGYIGRKYDDLS